MRTECPHDGFSVWSEYVEPVIVDQGDLVALTAFQGTAGTEDGMGKSVVAGVGGVGGVSVGVGP